MKEIDVKNLLDIPFLGDTKNHELYFKFDAYDHGDKIRHFTCELPDKSVCISFITSQDVILSEDELIELITEKNITYFSLAYCPHGAERYTEKWVYINK